MAGGRAEEGQDNGWGMREMDGEKNRICQKKIWHI